MAAVAVTVAIVSLALGARRIATGWAASWRLAPFGESTLAFALAFGGFLVPCAVAARAVESFDAGLVAAAATGIGLMAFGRRCPNGRAPLAPATTRAVVWLVQFVLLALYAYVSWRYQMHDEHGLFSHKSMIEQLRRNEYPLYYPSLPGGEARYHYGFDLLAGGLARAYGLTSDLAIDLVGLGLVWFMGWAAAAVVADEGAERSAPLAAVAVHLGAGLAFVLLAGEPDRHPRCLAQYHEPSCGVELFPTQFLNVFQHPVAVGVPMFLAFVLVVPRLIGSPTRWMAGASSMDIEARPRSLVVLAGLGTVVLGGLAVGQFVYFALGCLAALAFFAMRQAVDFALGRLAAAADSAVSGRLAGWVKAGGGQAAKAVGPSPRASGWSGWRGALVLTGVLALGFGLAILEGGMLANDPSIAPNLVRLRTVVGFPQSESWARILWHHVVNLGIGFLLLPIFVGASVSRRRPQVALLTVFAIGGIVVAHLFDYTRSWDIVKFPSAASFALSLLYVAVADDWLRRTSGSETSAGVVARWGRRFGAALLMGTGATAALYVAVPLPHPYALYSLGNRQPDPLVKQTIDWWRSHGYRSEDVIYAQSNIAQDLSIFGGLSVVAQDADLYYMGVDTSVLQRQSRLARRVRATLDRRALEGLGVRWLMFSNEEVRNLGPRARAVLASPPPWLREVQVFEGRGPDKDRRIWRIDLRPNAAAEPR